MFKETFKRGFTLIELLVVIAIIGILASVILASLATARDKGTNAAIQSSVSSVRDQAEIVGDSPSGAVDYTNVCSDAKISQIKTDITNKMGSGGAYCAAVQSAWAFAGSLKNGGYTCVDSTGYATTTTTGSIPTTGTVCNTQG